MGQGSQAKVNLAIRMVDSRSLAFDINTYVPEYYAIKIYIKPYLRKQRSFARSTSNASSISGQQSGTGESTGRRRARAFL